MCGPGIEPLRQGGPRSRYTLTAGTYHLRGRALPTGDLVDLFVVDGRLSFVPASGATTVLDGGWLLPGLVDAHAHLALASPAGAGATVAERVQASARVQLMAGVLLIREPGGPDHSSTAVWPGRDLPRTITSGRFLAPPNGYFPGLAREVAAAGLAQAVAEEAAAGSGWVKLIGDFLDAEGRLVANWTPAALTAAASAAHRSGARITVHAILPETVVAAVEAGVDGVEHGTGMPRDLLPVLAQRDVAWVPTMVISDAVRAWAGQSMAAPVAGLVNAWLDGLGPLVAAASRAGVRILAGTDAGLVPHGVVAAEVALLLDAGVPADVAVGAASWEARAYLGLAGIEEGAPADLVAFGDDPRMHPATLDRPIVTVLDGRLLVPDVNGRPGDIAGTDRLPIGAFSPRA